jgi:hypothetical protein
MADLPYLTFEHKHQTLDLSLLWSVLLLLTYTIDWLMKIF